MPTYRYRCGACGEELEVWQSITDDPLTTHEACGGDLVKVLSAAGIVLKGSGFYKTDSRSSNGSRTAKSDADSGSKADTSSSGADTKSDASGSGSSGAKKSSDASGSSGSTGSKQ
jgi:putative FmdB family regulatory protein